MIVDRCINENYQKLYFSKQAECLPSSSDSKDNERKYVFDVLKENNYPKHFLNNCLKPVISSRKTSENDNSMMGFAVVPYVHMELRNLSREFWVVTTLKLHKNLF